MPASLALLHLALGLERGHNAIEVVGLDLHGVRQLADRDAGPGAHELERLYRACAATAWTASAPAARAAPSGACASAATVAADARERRGRLLQPLELVDERAQLAQPAVDLLALLL